MSLRVRVAHDRRSHEPVLWPLAANPGMIPASAAGDHHPRNMCAAHIFGHNFVLVRGAHIMHAMVMEPEIANLLGELSLAVMDRIEQGARDIIGHAGETPAALMVIGYGPKPNDKLRRILGLSHSGTIRPVDRLVSDRLVERRPGKEAGRSPCISPPKARRPERIADLPDFCRRIVRGRLVTIGKKATRRTDPPRAR